MCRYDDGDYEWYVDSTNPLAVSEKDERCEDCGRRIATGETHTVFTAMPSESEGSYVFVAQVRLEGQKYLDLRRPWTIVDDDRAEELEDLPGVLLDEIHEHELNPPDATHHVSCNQCRAANRWLMDVCDQHVVMVTVLDLDEHWHEYTPEQLGPDFATLYKLSRQGWRTRDFGNLIPVHVIERLAGTAVDYAIAAGIAA